MKNLAREKCNQWPTFKLLMTTFSRKIKFISFLNLTEGEMGISIKNTGNFGTLSQNHDLGK